MQKGHGSKALVLCLLITVVACAGGISRQTRSRITYFGSFPELQQEPHKYEGEIVLWGGRVIETQVKDGATEIVVLQLELGNQDRPMNNDQSHGRFLITSPQFLDPALYLPGTLITVAGRLQGSETRPIGAMPYTYPRLDPIEIKKWPAGIDDSPRFHFGIGIGTHF